MYTEQAEKEEPAHKGDGGRRERAGKEPRARGHRNQAERRHGQKYILHGSHIQGPKHVTRGAVMSYPRNYKFSALVLEGSLI